MSGSATAPFPVSLLAAYYATRAAIAWALLDHDEAKVQAFYEKFYRLARRYSRLRFDPARAAALGLRYNEAHRRRQRAFAHHGGENGMTCCVRLDAK